MSFKELAELEGRLVILRFNDGHQVKAKLVSVDLDEPQEIIYVVSEVLVAGPPQLAGVVAGTAAAAGPSELESVSVDS